MKEKIKMFLKGLLLLLIAIWILDKLPFEEKINQQISAKLYRDGSVIGETAITIEGTKTNYLFHHKNSFFGTFSIPQIEKTQREGVHANIDWQNDDDFQRILFYGYGNFYSSENMGIVTFLFINESMDQFVLMLTDHTVIATSDELAAFYTKHVTFHGNGVTYIEGVEAMPQID